MISGYASAGLVDEAFASLFQMRESGIRPTGFTFSIAACCVVSVRQAKQVHANAVRNGFDLSNTVLANSFVNMYGTVGLVEYASSMFRVMENRDTVSWNTMMSVFGDSGQGDRALECLIEMRGYGLSMDAVTASTAISVCSDHEDAGKGEQLLAYCFKVGYLSNSIVSSAVIDMYSKCGRLDDSVRLFQEMEIWDSALCNSLASGYARNWRVSEALRLFVASIRIGIRPTEFTFASILSSSSCLGLTEQGCQIHCWIVKLGLEVDRIIASALVDMYTKLGAIESAMKIFSTMARKDLISCNTMILGLAQNGQPMLALRIFEQMLVNALQPDRITLLGVLSACVYGGMISEGKSIFLSMEEKYGIEHGFEHYACIVDMMGQAGRLQEAMNIIESMSHKPTASVWNLLLEACWIHEDLKFAEIVAEKVMELEPNFSLPYTVLSQIYSMRGKWESVARVRKMMSERRVKKVTACSWIGLKNCIFVFESDSILHYGGESTYSVMRLLVWEMKEKGYVPEQHEDG